MRASAVCVSAIAVTFLTGCSLVMGTPSDKPAPQIQEKERPAVVTEVLKDVEPLSKIDGVPTSKQFFDQMEKAGYDPEDLEATIDASPLGNDVPSKMFGVRVKEGCVIGEVRQGTVSGSLYPPTDSTDSCLFGTVDRPEGVKAPTGEKRSEDDDDNGVGFLPGDDLHERKDGKSSGSSDGSTGEGSSGEGSSGEGSSNSIGG